MLLFKKSNATKIPKKNDSIKFNIEVFWILNPILIFILFCISILSINPTVLPNKKIAIRLTSKILHFYPAFFDPIWII